MRPTPTHHLPLPLRRLLAPLLSQEPAAQLIRSTARQQWRLLPVEVLSAPEGSRFNWSTHPLLGLWPEAASWLNTLPATALFISLLALAVLLQGLQSLSRLANNVSMRYFSPECRARVTAPGPIRSLSQ